MKKLNNVARGKSLLFETLEAATYEDTDALIEIIKHFEGYIAKLSTREYQDSYGIIHTYVDEYIRGELISKLLDFTINFDILE